MSRPLIEFFVELCKTTKSLQNHSIVYGCVACYLSLSLCLFVLVLVTKHSTAVIYLFMPGLSWEFEEFHLVCFFLA